MQKNRVLIMLLATFLFGLLAWMMIVDVGDWTTRLLVAVGVFLGIVHLIGGGFSRMTMQQMGISADENARGHISAGIYLPIILVALIAAVVGLAVVLL